MQLNAVGKEKQDRFKNYMEKTYKKTASLMANSCKAVRHVLCYSLLYLLVLYLCFVYVMRCLEHMFSKLGEEM